jgi:hypothetical protein
MKRLWLILLIVPLFAQELSKNTPERVGLSSKSLLLNNGGEKSEEKMTVAVLSFDPKGISLMESQALTDYFTSEINNTGSAIITDRGDINNIFSEQNIEASGCIYDDCVTKIGALLNVEFIIKGSLVKLGDNYVIDVKMFEVSQSKSPLAVTNLNERNLAITKTFDKSTSLSTFTKKIAYNGPVDGLITEIEILAWEIMGRSPPNALLGKRFAGAVSEIEDIGSFEDRMRYYATIRSVLIPGWGQLYTKNRFMAKAFIGTEAFLGVLAYFSYKDYNNEKSLALKYQESYKLSTNFDEMRMYKEKTEGAMLRANGADDQYQIMLYIMGTVWLANIAHAYMTGTDQFAVTKKTKFDLVYNPKVHQPQLRLSIALD